MDENKCVVDERAELINANNYLRSHIKEAEDIANKSRKEYEIAQETIKELEREIRFLEGQIEAYQYCMNCKR